MGFSVARLAAYWQVDLISYLIPAASTYSPSYSKIELLKCKLDWSLFVAAFARSLSMLASTAEKATWCVQSFCLVKSSYENDIVGVGMSAAHFT